MLQIVANPGGVIVAYAPGAWRRFESRMERLNKDARDDLDSAAT